MFKILALAAIASAGNVTIHKDTVLFCEANLNKLQLIKQDQRFASTDTFETANVQASNIIVDANNNIYVSGIAYNANNQTKLIIYKFDENGNLLFQSLTPIDNLTNTFDLKILKNKLVCGTIASNTLSIIELDIECRAHTKTDLNCIDCESLPTNSIFTLDDNQIIIGHSNNSGDINIIKLNKDNTAQRIELAPKGELKKVILHNNKIFIYLQDTLFKLELNGQIDETLDLNSGDNLSIQNSSFIVHNSSSLEEHKYNKPNITIISKYIDLKNRILEGTGNPGDRVKVFIDKRMFKARVNDMGNWQINLTELTKKKYKLNIETTNFLEDKKQQSHNLLIPALKIEKGFKSFIVIGQKNATIDVKINTTSKEDPVLGKTITLTRNNRINFNVSHLKPGEYQISVTETDTYNNTILKNLNLLIQ